MSQAKQAARMWSGLRSRRGAEASVAVAALVMTSGLFFGDGTTRTLIDVSDGLTWITDSTRGELIEVNPATGRAQTRLSAGQPGDRLTVEQTDGRLIFVNESTGTMTSVDLATLLASGRRSGANAQTKVLLHGSDAYVVDGAAGTVARVDPATFEPLGRLWTSTSGLADVVVDGSGSVWALDEAGELTELSWSADSEAFQAASARTVTGMGRNAHLVPHGTGITAFSAETGAIVQVGTGRDLVSAAPAMRGSLAVAKETDKDLVAVSATDSGTVVLVVGQREIRQVATRDLGCAKPGAPATLHNVIYVPCLGQHRVIRLTASGEPAGSPIVTADTGDPELVADDGRLIVNVSGAAESVQIGQDGQTSSILRYDPTVVTQSLTAPQPDPTESQKVRAKAEQAHDRGKQRPQRTRYSPPAPPAPQGRNNAGPTGNGQGQGSGDALGPGSVVTDGTGGSAGTPDPNVSTTLPGPEVTTPTPSITDPSTPTPTTPTPTTSTVPPPPAKTYAAPTAVSAIANPDGSVDVSWAHSGTAAAEFRIYRTSAMGTVLTSVSGTSRAATIGGLPPGTAGTFTVVATFADSAPLTSSPSGSVTTYTGPGAVSGLTAAESAHDASSIGIRTSWSAAAPNGRPISRYAVTVTYTPTGASQSVNVTGTSASVSLACAQCSGGQVQVSVTAYNSAGAGAARSTTVAASQLQAPMPSAGVEVIFDGMFSEQAGKPFGRVRFSLRPPADWANFTGTCAMEGDGATTPVACNATTLTVRVGRSEPDSGGYSEELPFTMVATEAGTGRESRSKTYVVHADWTATCGSGTGRICP